MPVGELFLGAVLNVLFDRLTSPELVRFLRQEGFETKINKWRRTLEMINAMLGDAEEKQLTNKAVKIWLDDLEELAYDAEDMLDEFEYEATARKMKMDELESSKFWKHVPAGFCNWSLDAIRFRFRMRCKVNDVTTRFDRLCKLRQDLGLQVNTEETPSRSSAAPRRPPTSAHRTEPAIYGRNEDKKKLLEMVSKNEPTDANFLVMPVVGMGGVGKTTLAREVFIASKVEFQVNAWVCVSDGEFNVTRISKSILENITGSSSLPNDLATVQDKLKEQVVGKKFLLVLDDVWSCVHSEWATLLSPFRASAVGSRIIVTTRDEGVALKLRPSGFHRVSLLKPEDCWSVFSMCAFENGAVQKHREIELIREKVIEMSDGLPLAAKTLGGLLRSKKIDEWLGVLNSKLWNLSENDGSEIPAALKVSYHHLPSHLRRCFAFCSIFPKDHEFGREDVVLLWIADGLVQPSRESKQLEELGNEYIDDLLGRSLFEQSSSDNGCKFVMHDLVHDLAQWAFEERSLRLDDVSADRHLGGLKKVRHVSYTYVRYMDDKRFEVFQEDEDLTARIRTFFPIRYLFHRTYITKSVLFELLSKLKRLRVLSLENYYITEVPIPMGGLKHLRYLNLSKTMIGSLPESASLSYNLQILLLRHCSRLAKLPSNLKYLIKLRHLDIEGAFLIKEMPLGMEKLQNLQKLSNFIVGKGECSNLKDLMSLSMLHEELCISRLDNVTDCDHKILRDKKDLEKLLLEWGYQFHELRSEVTEEKVLDMLQPHENLQELTITCYGGTKFSRWVGDVSYSNMKVLRLKNCEKCTDLPSLGVLGSLEKLTIEGMELLTRISSDFYGKDQPFKSLKALCFKDLPVWGDWEPIEENQYGVAFPYLEKLSIKKCPQLSGSLPRRLCALEKLIIEDCEQLVVSFSNIPELCKIKINGCKRIACDDAVDFMSIRYLTLSKISEFSNQLMQECFGKAELQQIKRNRSEVQLEYEICPEKPPVSGLQSIRFLRELVISYCSNIVSFAEVCSLPHLNKLEILHCNALISLPEEMKMKNECLESLKIQSCDSLEFIVRGQLPPSLKQLEISECSKLESLWDEREGSCSSSHGKETSNNTNASLLEYLRVSDCRSLTCLSSIIQLPAALKHLEFVSCQQLTTITEGFYDSNTSLEVISIGNCENLQIPNGLHNLRHLRELTICDCPNIECFPEEGLADTNLRQLKIENCANLKALPDGLRSLNSLEDLKISRCPSITSFNLEEFPANLKSLCIEECENAYRPLVESGLQNLTSLTSLEFRNLLDVTSFPQQEMEMMLPSSLTILKISFFPKLKQLWSQGFQNLTSLQYLDIRDCPDLTSLGDQGLPSSLEFLMICDCENLTCFPRQGLPSSLKLLYIYNCPKLGEECRRNKGREWSKISNILEVMIDLMYIFELEEEEEAQSSSCYSGSSFLPCLPNCHPVHCCNVLR